MDSVDKLFEGEVRTGSMVAAAHSAIHYDIEGCDFHVNCSLSWSGVSSVEERIKTLKKVANKIRLENMKAAHILTTAITKHNIAA